MGERPIRVALVDHCARMGGAEWSLLRLASALDERVVSPLAVLGEEGPLADRLREAGIEVEICPLHPRLSARHKEDLASVGLADPRAAARLLRAAGRLDRLLRARGVEVVHTNSLKAHAVGGLAGRLAGARVVWHLRDHLEAPYLPAGAARVMRAAASVVPHAVIAVSESVARTSGRSDAVVVHNPVPLPELAPRSANGRLRVGMVGRIAPWKGQHVFLAAAARLAERFPQAEFVVCGAPLFGEDAFERELHSRAEEAPLAGRVRFLGFREDVFEVYRELDVAVHASTLPEPFGNVIVEAMASAVPVVAAAAGGALELVEDGRTGLLVRPGDPAALAQALEGLLGDADRRGRLAAAARLHVVERLSADRSARAIEDVYRRLASLGSGTRGALLGPMDLHEAR